MNESHFDMNQNTQEQGQWNGRQEGHTAPGGIGMNMEDVRFADLSENTLNQIRRLEHSLRRETHRDLYLLAYEKPNDSPIPRH